MSKRTATARSLAECERLGWVADNADRWVVRPAIGANGKPVLSKRGRPLFELVVKRDLFGVFDHVAFDPVGRAVYYIQTTSDEGGGHHFARRAKIRSWPHLADLLSTGARVEVWSWAKRGARGRRKLWTLRREPVSASVQQGAGQAVLEPQDTRNVVKPGSWWTGQVNPIVVTRREP